jgi:hypothetical protein
MRELAEVMRPFTTGSDYVNQIGPETDEGSERIKGCCKIGFAQSCHSSQFAVSLTRMTWAATSG